MSPRQLSNVHDSSDTEPNKSIVSQRDQHANHGDHTLHTSPAKSNTKKSIRTGAGVGRVLNPIYRYICVMYCIRYEYEHGHITPPIPLPLPRTLELFFYNFDISYTIADRSQNKAKYHSNRQ